MREKEIEQKLVREVRRSGGISPKFVSPGMRGMPDRLVLMPKGRVYFVELKRPGAKPGPLQTARHEMLREMGVRVYVVDSAEKVMEVIDEIRTT